MSETVTINYRRPPDRLDVFTQHVVRREGDLVVTLLDSATVSKPVEVDGRVILEPGAPVVWFTWRNRWYDVGRFHTVDGEFTGCYANILTPVDIDTNPWETTDLFLDVWVGSDGEVRLLDEADFQDAVDRDWISSATAATAREHAESLIAAARQGVWPHREVHQWTLERARAELGRTG